MYTDYKAHVCEITRQISPDWTDKQHLLLKRQLSLHRKTKAEAKLLHYFGLGGGGDMPPVPPPYGSTTGDDAWTVAVSTTP